MTRITHHFDLGDVAVAAAVLTLVGMLGLAGLPAVAGAAAVALPVTLAARRGNRAKSCLRGR